MATYGSIPGVKISTSTGTVTGVIVGRESYLILVGVGNSSATVSTNSPTRIEGRNDVDDKFGAGSDVAEAYRDALANGANPNYVYGIRASTSSGSESPTSSSGSVTNTPVVPDISRISAEDGSSNSLDIELYYESPPPTPSSSGVLYLNPHSGEWDSQDTVGSISYEYADWQSAIEEADTVMGEAEFGVLTPLTTDDTAKDEAQSIASTMRSDLKFVNVIAPVQHNATTGNAEPKIDTSAFSSSYDDDTLFTFGPTGATADEALTETALNGAEATGHVAGLMTGNLVTEPIYDNALQAAPDLAQGLSRSDVTDLRDQYVIPLRDTGAVRIEDNHSTFTQTGAEWERDFFRRRVVDLTMAVLYQVARREMGSILDDETVEDVADTINNEFVDLVDDRLLEPGGQTFEVNRDGANTIAINASITPYGVAKSADVDLKVNA